MDAPAQPTPGPPDGCGRVVPPQADPALRRPCSATGPAPSPGPSSGDDRDRGAATVEAALALCTLVVFLAVAVGAIAAAAGAVRCVDAARELARLAARGEPERGRSVAEALAPAGARLALRTEGDVVIAEVAAEPLGPLPVRIGGRAVAALEPGAAAP
jgi:hypothetical protein